MEVVRDFFVCCVIDELFMFRYKMFPSQFSNEIKPVPIASRSPVIPEGITPFRCVNSLFLGYLDALLMIGTTTSTHGPDSLDGVPLTP